MKIVGGFRTYSLLFTLFFLSACGFQLRGAIDLPALYEKVYLVDKGYLDIAGPLKKRLKNAGVSIVSSSDSASSTVILLARDFQRRAMNIAGREIREYELRLNISFVVQDHQGAQLGEQQTVNVVRNYENDQNNALSKDNEEQIIRQEMNQTAVTQILYRLKAIAQ
ncbi:MAG: hypothetical protein KZQ83_11880 [gamma proteobacterium symbiont of Taylorina sp.]|nr:hypothetical protein [gamma proteobacterium symbiont of Taylorina sp.]